MTSALLLEHRDAQPQYSCYRYDRDVTVSCGPHSVHRSWVKPGELQTTLAHLSQHWFWGPLPVLPFSLFLFTTDKSFLKTSRTWQRNTTASIHFFLLEGKISITIPILPTGKEKITFHQHWAPRAWQHARKRSQDCSTVAENLMGMVTNGPVNNSVWASHTTPQFS